QPATRVVPVATVEDIHSIDRKDLERKYNRNGSLDFPNDNNDQPATRVVPVATVEDIHEITPNHHPVSRQPYQNRTPVVQPVSVKKESVKQRRKRQENTPNYQNSNYSSPSKNTNDSYVIGAETKLKKRKFIEFVKDVFSEENSDSNPIFEESRPSRTSSSREYKSNSSKSEKGTTRTSRQERNNSRQSKENKFNSNN
ncbi:MAG: hypothetical protein ACPG49_11395, partial [Chitinophagales bacterium]